MHNIFTWESIKRGEYLWDFGNFKSINDLLLFIKHSLIFHRDLSNDRTHFFHMTRLFRTLVIITLHNFLSFIVSLHTNIYMGHVMKNINLQTPFSKQIWERMFSSPIQSWKILVKSWFMIKQMDKNLLPKIWSIIKFPSW